MADVFPITDDLMTQNLLYRWLRATGINRVEEGLSYQSDSGLTITINPGEALVKGYLVIEDVAVEIAVNDDDTTYAYLQVDLDTGQRTFPTNTTGVTPDNAIPLFSAVAVGGSITEVTDLRPTGNVEKDPLPNPDPDAMIPGYDFFIFADDLNATLNDNDPVTSITSRDAGAIVATIVPTRTGITLQKSEINGHSVLRYNGSGALAVAMASLAVAAEWTLFSVFKVTNLSVRRQLFACANAAGDTAASWAGIDFTTNALANYGFGTSLPVFRHGDTDAAVAAPGTVQVLCQRYTSGQTVTEYWVDREQTPRAATPNAGTAVASAAIGSEIANWIGDSPYGGGGAAPWLGDCMAVAVYRSRLPDAGVLANMAYLCGEAGK